MFKHARLVESNHLLLYGAGGRKATGHCNFALLGKVWLSNPTIAVFHGGVTQGLTLLPFCPLIYSLRSCSHIHCSFL